MMYEFMTILAILIALGVLFSVRACKESERVIVISRGKFRKIKGPGLYLLLPHSWLDHTTIKINDVGKYLGGGWAEINGQNVPVKTSEEFDTDEQIKVRTFINQEILIVKDA